MHAEVAYLFRHALLRDAAYQMQMPADRGRIHALAVDLIEEIFCTEEELDAVAAELAEHCRLALETAHDSALLEKQRAYSWRGAREALSTFRNGDAERLLHSYLDVCDKNQKVDCLCELVSLYVRTSNLAAGEQAARKAVEIARKTPGTHEVKARRSLAEVSFRRGMVPLAIAELKTAYHSARASGNAEQCHQTAMSQANVLQFVGRMHSAARLLRTCLGYFQAGDRGREVARVKNRLGNLLYVTGRYEDAEALLQEVRNSDESENPAVLAPCLQTLANLYEDTLRISEAESAYETVRNLAGRIGDRAMQGNAVGNLAILHHHAGRMDDAEPLYHTALAAHRESGLQHSEAISLSNIAGYYRDKKDLQLAAKLFSEALVVAERSGSIRVAGVIEGNLAGVVRDLGRLDEARSHYERAMGSHRSSSNLYFEGVHGTDWAILELFANNLERARSLWSDHITTLRRLDAKREISDRIEDMRKVCGEVGTEPFE